MVLDRKRALRLVARAALAVWAGAGGDAGAHSVATTQPAFIGQIAAIAGTITFSPTTGTVTGAGLLHVGGPTQRGIVIVTRTSSVTASASAPGGVTGNCGGTSVTAHLNFDNSGCATAGTGACAIYVGAVIDLPNNVPAGVCTIPTFTVNVDFF